jgi:RHS repeat-associated protein
VRFRYDARNRRVARQDGDAAWKYWVFTPDGTPLAELTMPATSGSAWSVQREYVWLEGRPVAQVEYPGPTGGDEGYVYLFHVDHLGQPRALTSMAGVTVWSASPPRPYGDLVEATAMDPANGRYVVTNLRLPGQYDERLLNSVGLQGPYYNGARWYLPSMARYMELDPAALRGGLNGGYAPDWYGYANGNPLRWTDPKGEEAIGAIVGAIFGGVQGALSARTTGGNWVAGMFIGAGIGLGMGLLDPSLGIGVMITIGGGASFLGSVGGQLWGGGPGNFGSLSTIDWWAVGGATTGGVLAGAFAGTYNQFAGPAARQLAGAATPWLTQLGEEVLKNGIGALTGYISELEGTALGHGGRLPEPTQTGRLLTLAEGLGCK